MPQGRRGSLIVVGSGIEAVAQVTLAAQGAIANADEVLYIVGDWLTADWITSLNPAAESLHPFYSPGKSRRATYAEIVGRILRGVRQGHQVCALFYGHPGVFVEASHEAIRTAREEGYPARMLPGVSAEDCLFAELGIDPAAGGCQSYEATDFLIRRRTIDTATPLVLWQVGVVGKADYQPLGFALDGFRALAEYLVGLYGSEHEAVLYEAPKFAIGEPRVERVALGELDGATPSAASTLFVPAKGESELDTAMVARLGMDGVG